MLPASAIRGNNRMDHDPQSAPAAVPASAGQCRRRLPAAPSNGAALAWLERTADWPDHRLTLWGEPGCGKTHLLRL
jgi:chromosomal replication initiation ATPase DnaA